MEFEDGVKFIGERAFQACNSIESIIIPKSIEEVGAMAFYGDNNLKEVIFKGKTMDEVRAMENYPWGIKDTSAIKCEAIQ